MAKKKRITPTGPSPIIFRDRVKEFRRVRAAELVGAPWNWRDHPPEQHDAFAGSLETLGFYDALKTRVLPDDRLELIDGHLRQELVNARVGPDTLIPVLVTDLDEDEAKLANLTHDPMAAMAQANAEKVEALLREVSTDNDALASLMSDVAKSAGVVLDSISGGGGAGGPAEATVVPERWEIIVECDGEPRQRELFERLTAEGLTCRVLTL